MGIALQTAVREDEQKKQQRQTKNRQRTIFLIIRRRLSEFGDAQAIKVAAKSENEARWLASRLYTAECPPHLTHAIHALHDIQSAVWLAKRWSDCLPLRPTRHRGVLAIEIRTKKD